MKLYYSPGACSLAARISLLEAGLPAEYEKVDLKSKTTEYGYDYRTINPKGYVPLLVLDDGQAITENVAVLAFIADVTPELGPGGPLGRIRLIEMLAYLSAELHVAFKPLWHAGSEAEKDAARDAIIRRFELLDGHVAEHYLLGPRFTVADAYLFVMLRWARTFGVPLSASLDGYFERVLERSAVRQALTEEGLIEEAAESAPIPPVAWTS